MADPVGSIKLTFKPIEILATLLHGYICVYVIVLYFFLMHTSIYLLKNDEKPAEHSL